MDQGTTTIVVFAAIYGGATLLGILLTGVWVWLFDR